MSFAAIAGRLGLRRSRDALDAFHRALRAIPDADKPRLIREELVRLAGMETRIRSRDAADPEKMEHRLRALERLREQLPAAPAAEQ